jgi:hypothetical protein
LTLLIVPEPRKLPDAVGNVADIKSKLGSVPEPWKLPDAAGKVAEKLVIVPDPRKLPEVGCTKLAEIPAR